MISYFNAGTQWAVAKGNPQKVSIDDACGKSVGVQKATVQGADIEARSAKCTAAGKPAIDIQQFNLQSDVTTAVTSGRWTRCSPDSPVIGYAVQQSPQLEALGDVYDSAPLRHRGAQGPGRLRRDRPVRGAVPDRRRLLQEDRRQVGCLAGLHHQVRAQPPRSP